MSPTKKTIRILKEIKATLQTHFGEEIVEVILFGSRANGKAHRWSDYDLLILLKNPYNWQKKREIGDVLYDIMLKWDIITDTHFLAQYELNTLRGKQPIYDNAMLNGIYA
jgi:uncharacterized protein